MSRDDAVLLDLKLAALAIREFVAGFERSSFLADRKTQSAVLHQLMVIGEAVKRVAEPVRSSYPGIPWQPMGGCEIR